MSSMAQLNTRMKPELKASGDSMLELYGISPSEVIRTLWEKISLGEEAMSQLVAAFLAEPAVGTTRTAAREEGSSGIARMVRERQASFERESGLDPTTYVPLDEDELNDLVYQDYLEERQASHAG